MHNYGMDTHYSLRYDKPASSFPPLLVTYPNFVNLVSLIISRETWENEEALAEWTKLLNLGDIMNLEKQNCLSYKSE